MSAPAVRAANVSLIRSASRGSGLFPTVAPFVFVFLWSTGFIGTKYGLRDAEPFTLLSLRMAISAVLIALFGLAIRTEWPRSRRAVGHAAVSGLLMHGGYLGGVFAAMDHGMPAGLAAIIVGLQPILTAVLAQMLLREGVTPRQWAGLLLGFGGVLVVVLERMRSNDVLGSATVTAGAFVAIAIALVSTTLGAIYQKRHGQGMALVSGTAVQYTASGLIFLLLALSTETMEVRWTLQLVATLGWMVFGMSFGAVSLLLLLIRRSSVSRVSSYLYLVPPLTALEAYLLFDERLTALALVGMAAVAVGVALVVVTRKVDGR